MTHHLLPEVDRAALAPLRHAFLIRDPAELLASYAQGPGPPDPRRSRPLAAGRDLPDVRRPRGGLARHPGPPGAHAAGALRGAHRAVRPGMLSWPAGPRDTDGVWAPHWYHRSGGPPGSARTARRTRPCRPGWPRWPGSASRSTSGCMRYRRCTAPQPHARGERRCCRAFDERNRDLIVNVGGQLTHRDQAGGQPVRLRRPGRRRGLGRAPALPGPDLPARRAPGQAAPLGGRARFHHGPVRRGDHRADPPHAAGERDDRQRAHPAHSDPRGQDHQRDGPPAEPVRPDPDRAGRVQAAGLRPVRHLADHLERAPPAARLARSQDPPQQPADLHPGQDRGEHRGRR